MQPVRKCFAAGDIRRLPTALKGRPQTFVHFCNDQTQLGRCLKIRLEREGIPLCKQGSRTCPDIPFLTVSANRRGHGHPAESLPAADDHQNSYRSVSVTAGLGVNIRNRAALFVSNRHIRLRLKRIQNVIEIRVDGWQLRGRIGGNRIYIAGRGIAKDHLSPFLREFVK